MQIDFTKEWQKVYITPEMAEELMKKNVGNRKIRNGRVKKYERAMKAGLWDEKSSIPIYITSTGIVKDGQHRLLAIIESGKAILTPIVIVSEKAHGYDQNGVRNAVDSARMQGVLMPSKSNEIISEIFLEKIKQLGEIPEDARVQYFLNHESDLLRADQITDSIHKATTLTRNAAFGLLAYSVIRYNENIDDLLAFQKIINSGFGLGEKRDYTAITARNQLLSLKISSLKSSGYTGGRIPKHYRRNIIHHAFYDYTNNVSRKKSYNDESFDYYVKRIISDDDAEIKRLIEF